MSTDREPACWIWLAKPILNARRPNQHETLAVPFYREKNYITITNIIIGDFFVLNNYIEEMLNL